MEWILAIIFGVVFAAGSDAGLIQFAMGATLGWLLGRLVSQESKITSLEQRLQHFADQTLALHKHINSQQTESREKDPVDNEMVSQAPLDTPAEKPAPAAMLAESRKYETPEESQPVSASGTAARPVTEPMQPRVVQVSAQAHAENVRAPMQSADNWRANAIICWLLSGNIPVKLGVLVSFFGVAFLLKYAVEQGWMRLPIELRLIGVASFGAGLLYLGWRLRESHRVYALSIQGGGVGILYLTTYSALRLFHVLPPMMSFFFLALIAAGAGWLAVRQNARALAVLGSIGGFLAPLLASTGTGSHVGLFTYYLILNIGIAGVAAFRHWRMLNLLGFVFTFGIGLIWGAQYYQEQYFSSVEPFLIAHFLLYTAVAVLSAMRHSFRLRGYVDSTLVFGLPLVVFPLQAALLNNESLPLAWSATVLAGFYAGLSRWLKGAGEAMQLLAQTYFALAVIFATLAVPLWLDAPWVANTWALEAAAMIAIGLKQRRSFTHYAGVIMLAIAACSYLVSLESLHVEPLLLNERFIGGFVLCAVLSFCAWIYVTDGAAITREIPMEWLTGTTAWFGWLLLAHTEIFEHAADRLQPAFSLLTIAILSFAMERAAQRWLPHLRILAAAVLPLLFMHLIWWPLEFSHYLAVLGWLAWPAAFAALAWTLHVLPNLRSVLLTGTIWLGAVWLGIETSYLNDEMIRRAVHDWNELLVLLVLLAYALAANNLAKSIYPQDYDARIALLPLFGLLFIVVIVWNMVSPGRFEPLPYLPLLNLQLLASVAFAAVAWRIFRSVYVSLPWLKVAGAFGFYLVTLEIARGTHHLGGVAFTAHAIWHSGGFQAAVSIIWSLLGIAGMVMGARMERRALWMLGAGLMAVVVAKLFLVDLGNSGSLTRVISFIGVGVLLLVVGYLAPVPALAAQRKGVA